MENKIPIAFPDCAKCQRLYEKWVREDYPQPGKDYDVKKK